ncbi:piggyBac transposable element-derived protein 4-like [Pseudochaenichthys georgianus]|uniref:piggyBac transposable element-derived protein 4-like n=1 Tax=Pseudochaenichthys georgianus TaxID=52239 RepID=UPI00146A4FA9|nr:piggyBac transposable element-derived protein 4-like [Pseudochaenichthys georgianus]XP_033953454.1 piggyBac transposable element-derived protein 4-like [Pseudochaenichthys georgianus]
MAKTTVAAELEIILASSSEDDGESEPEGFDSSEEEEYWDNKDPFEDGEDSQQPEPQSVPATMSRSTVDQGPAKRTCREHVLPTQPIAARVPSSPPTQQPAPLSWKTDKDPDTAPPVPSFKPARTPGPQLSSRWKYKPFDLFKLFFSAQTVQTICINTNKQAAKQMGNGKKYKWIDLTVDDFYKYMGLLLYMALLKLDTVLDYWRQDHFLSVPLPAQVMTRDRYRTISWNLHLSDPGEDVQNDSKKGTSDHDRLFRLKPLMNSIKTACMSYYHPHKYLAVDERKLDSKAKTVITLYMKAKPTKWGFKLFALTDSKNGYTVDFSVYTGKSDICSGHGLSYDVVMSLVHAGYLGTGYHIYMDNFYTSPKLFTALHALKFGACGTYRENGKDCPRTQTNALTAKSKRGSLRWIREGPLVFVKWMDNREVSVCSTIHEAYSGNTVQRKQKQRDGSWTQVETPCPTPVAEYNEHMGGVHLSDQLIHHYSAKHKTMRWYRSIFYHFLDIATTNSYILYKEICLSQKKRPMTRRAFMGELSAELCGKPLHTPPARGPASHLPVCIADVKASGISRKATTGRRRCEHCHIQGMRKDTPWKCKQCDVALCLLLDRNCFEAWHED